jgi:L-seryl-tRNA(Ser) seleniumtransferase
VSALLEHEEVKDWLHGLPRGTVVAAVQDAIAATRKDIVDGAVRGPVDVHHVLARAEEELARRSMPSLRRVINATGIVLHTGLGRAPLCDSAIEAIAEAASGYCNLELDLATGQRGRRSDHVAELLARITGAEAATVVNNNAAATYLILHVLACGREVIVSRGELIEIGGSFRLPDIMRASGAVLHEVGTTNRTRLSDYEKAINDKTAGLLRVHTSNYRIVGFTEDVPIDKLVTLARQHNLIAIDDLGSGVLFDPGSVGLPEEPSVSASITAGADVVCFSGDKLLGGPQCGIVVGRKELIDKLNDHPLMRTYRVDKLTLLALEATLRHYQDIDDALVSIPTLSMLRALPEELADRARSLQEHLAHALPGEEFCICSDVGFAGGGSMPVEELPTVVIQWRPSRGSVEETIAALRDGEVPVIARVRDDAICFDLRTLRPIDFEPLVAAVASAVADDDDRPRDGIALPLL